MRNRASMSQIDCNSELAVAMGLGGTVGEGSHGPRAGIGIGYSHCWLRGRL